MGLFSDIGGAQDAQTLGIGGHDPVFDAVVHHFDKVTGAIRPAMQIALLSRAADVFAPRGAGDVARSRSECRKNWIEMLDHAVFPADHHAIAALQAPYTAAGPDIDVVDSSRCQFPGPADVVDVIGIAAIDQDVVGL